MASRTGQSDQGKVDIEEALEYVDKTLDRVKVLYEQYFLGMQKQPPTQIHTDVERRLRDLQQLQIRNTGLRYRFATLQQKFGSYNSYWRRTLRQIENGTYIRNLSKISRNAALTGEAIPEEILAAMPQRMRDQVKRDREMALAIARRRDPSARDEADDEAGEGEAAPSTSAPAPVRNQVAKGTHVLAETDDLDIDAFFASMSDESRPDESRPDAPRPAGASASAASGSPAAAAPAMPRPTPAAPGIPRPAAAAPGMPRPMPPPAPGTRASQPMPTIPGARATGPMPVVPPPPRPSGVMPTPSGGRPPPGMNEAEVNALYAKYVKAKEAVGEAAGPGSYGKLLQTINSQAPKIMEQYKAKGVEFSVVVKDNQVIIKARPKT